MMALSRRRALVFIVAGPALVACGPNNNEAAPKIALKSAWMRPPPGGRDRSAAYLVIINDGGADTLLSVSSPMADDVQMHISETKDGISRMRREPSVPIAAHSKVTFAPTGRHLMMLGVKNGLGTGDEIPLTLVFRRAGSITITAIVGNGP